MNILLRNSYKFLTEASEQIQFFYILYIPALDERKIQQKLNSYKPLTIKEVQVLTRQTPLRQATSEEKDDMTKAVSKLLTKLHLLYTMGMDNVPKRYTFARNSMMSNFNKLYGERNAEEEKNTGRH